MKKSNVVFFLGVTCAYGVFTNRESIGNDPRSVVCKIIPALSGDGKRNPKRMTLDCKGYDGRLFFRMDDEYADAGEVLTTWDGTYYRMKRHMITESFYKQILGWILEERLEWSSWKTWEPVL